MKRLLPLAALPLLVLAACGAAPPPRMPQASPEEIAIEQRLHEVRKRLDAELGPLPTATPRKPCDGAIETAQQKIIENYRTDPADIRWSTPRLRSDGYCDIEAAIPLDDGQYHSLSWRIDPYTRRLSYAWH